MSADRNIVKSALLVCLIVALFAAVTDFAEGRWLSAAWIAYAGALSLAGAWKRTPRFIIASLPVWAAALIRLYFLEERPEGFIVLANARFSLFAMAAFFLAATHFIQRRSPMHRYMKGFAYTAAFTIILATLKENGDFVTDPHYRNLGYSYVLAFYAALFLVIGFIRSGKTLRLIGITLAVLVLAKLYLYDIWTMSTLVRIIAGFTLGLALVLLSIFYQKFRDRLFPKGGSAAAVIMLLLPVFLLASAILPVSVDAADFRGSGWKYYKEISGLETAVPGGAKAPVYGVIEPDADLARYAGSNDIRIVAGGAALPYFTRGMQSAAKLKGSLKPQVVFEESDREGSTYVLKLPEPPAGTEYTAIETASEGDYEAGVLISTGREAGRWETAEHRSIFKYSSDKYTSIKFHSGDNRYVRLRFDSRLKFAFPSAFYAPISTRSEYELDIPPERLTRDHDSDRGGSVYYYANEGKHKIIRLALRFSDGRYTRIMEVRVLNPGTKEYDFFMSTGLSRRSGDPDVQIIDFHRTVATAIKLVILDRDNAPLNLISMKAYIPREEIVFELPTDDNEKTGPVPPVRIYYGNPYAGQPGYDIADTFDASLGAMRLQPGPQIKNPDFGYSIVEPPLSTWIIRLLFIAGLLGLAYPVWRIFTDYAASGYGRQDGQEPKAPQ